MVSDKWTFITGSEKTEGWAHACSMSEVIFVNRKLNANIGTEKRNTIRFGCFVKVHGKIGGKVLSENKSNEFAR